MAIALRTRLNVSNRLIHYIEVKNYLQALKHVSQNAPKSKEIAMDYKMRV
jgi:hypothetical protein